MTSMLVALVLVCGSERWDVKVLTDPDAKQVALAPIASTVETLAAQPMPTWADHAPRHPEETHAYLVTVDVLAYKLEADRDYHIVIADPNDHNKTMVAESVDPACAAGSVVLDRISSARKQFLRLFAEPKTEGRLLKLKKPVRVKISGVAFFDRYAPGHEPTGAAHNGIELHPMISVESSP